MGICIYLYRWVKDKALMMIRLMIMGRQGGGDKEEREYRKAIVMMIVMMLRRRASFGHAKKSSQNGRA